MPGVPVISRLHIQTTLQRGRNFKMSLWPFCRYFQNELSAVEYDLPSKVHLMVNEQLSIYLNSARQCRTKGKWVLVHYLTVFSLLLHIWVRADVDAPCSPAPFRYWPDLAMKVALTWSIRITLHQCQSQQLNPWHRFVSEADIFKSSGYIYQSNISKWNLDAINSGTTLTPVDNEVYYIICSSLYILRMWNKCLDSRGENAAVWVILCLCKLSSSTIIEICFPHWLEFFNVTKCNYISPQTAE